MVLRQHLPAPPQSNAGGVFHALQGAGIGGIGLELHQRRGQRRAVVAQPLGQPIAVQHAAHLAAGGAACGQNDAVHAPEDLTALQRHGKALPPALQGGDGVAGPQGQPIRLSLQRQTQHIQHGIGGVGAGIQLAVGLLHRDKAQLVEKAQCFRHRKGLQRRAAEVRVGSVVVSRGGMAVGEVAPAVAGGQQLAAYPALPLQQRHPVPGVGESRQRRHQAGGPAADDADLTHGAVPPAACG